MRKCGFLAVLCVAYPALVCAADATVGFRGNWTGRFPDTKPPITWGRVSKIVGGLRCQAAKPEGTTPAGVPMPHGCVTEWLVLGSFPSRGGKEAADEAIVENEAELAPAEGETTNGKTWQRVACAGSVLEFESAFGASAEGNSNQIAYAHAYIYSALAGDVQLNLNSTTSPKVYCNGTLCNFKSKKGSVAYFAVVKLKKGWNRLLCKVPPPPKKIRFNTYPTRWAIDVSFRAVDPKQAESQNIVWATHLPGRAYAGTLVVGDKLFVMVEPGDLACLNKKDGRVEWVRSITYCEVANEEEKSSPEGQKAASLRKELDAWNEAWLTSGDLSAAKLNARGKIHWGIIRSMSAIDSKKYFASKGRNRRRCTPTPFSDGRNIYTWQSVGLAACFDLQGNSKWITLVRQSEGSTGGEHGNHSSPSLFAGRMINQWIGDLFALDVTNGRVLWQKGMGLKTQHTPTKIRIKDKELGYCGGVVFDPADGRVLWKRAAKGMSTPVIGDGVLFSVGSSKFWKYELPGAVSDPLSLKPGKGVVVSNLGRQIQHAGFAASPLYHEGLVYVVNVSGILYVIDAEAEKLVYRKALGMGREGSPLYFKGMCFNSPVLAGGHIYVGSADGITVVFKPGRAYEEVARNRIERIVYCDVYGSGRKAYQTETFTSTPVVDDDRMYLRGTGYLYCVGKTE